MNEETKKLLDKLDRIKIGIPYLNLSELLFLFLTRKNHKSLMRHFKRNGPIILN